jgi:2'-5' RNA ligase
MRLFVGIDIDRAIRENIERYVSELKQRAPQVKFVSPHTYHITLKFLGETAKVAEIRSALKKIEVRPFEIKFCGTGFFPNERAPRVFWAGIEAEPELRELATAVSWVLADLGFEEEASFKPHLTLARAGSGSPRPKPGELANLKLKPLRELTASGPEVQFGTMTAREFFLYESKLMPRGAQYSKVDRYGLVTP